MKKFLIILLLQSAVATILSAQESGACGTPTTPSKWTDEYLRNRGAYAKSNELLYVPLTIHIVGQNDGTGYLRVRNVLDALCTLNENFAPANIQFYLNGNIRYLNNSTLFNLVGTGNASSILRQNRVANSINCYFVGSIESSDGGPILGFANGIPSSDIVLRNSVISAGNPTLPHEMGHALGLYHTFYGWEEFEHNYNLNAPELVNFNRAVELVNKSNCDTAGDGICDTEPDYLSEAGWNCNNEGLSVVQQRDPSGAIFRSNGRNFMSYSNDNCQSLFSEQQIQAMRTNLTTQKRSFLNLQPPLPSVDSLVVTPGFPRQNDTVSFTAVTLEWDAVPNATNYIVEVSRFTNFASTFSDTYNVATNAVQLTNLRNNTTYYWRVRAYNRNSFCAKVSSVASFRAGTPSTTSVEDVATTARFQVFPNPMAEKQTLTIESDLLESTRLQVRLLDLSGKLLQTAAYDVISGENRLQFTPNNVTRGIYLLQFVADKINIVQKVVVQ